MGSTGNSVSRNGREIVEWAEDNSIDYELLLTLPANPDGDTRQLTAMGLDVFSTSGNQAMQTLSLIEGDYRTRVVNLQRY